MSKLDELDAAYAQLVQSGVQPSEVWNMTWPEYNVLLISKYEQEQASPSNSNAPDRANIIRCESFQDFAAVLAGTRGRVE